jgi:hypothetical protein
VAERGKARRYMLQLDYRFDRLLTIKLERVYQLLVPDRCWPLGLRQPVSSRIWRS